VKLAFNWADDEDLVRESPLKALMKSPPVWRERILTAKEWDQFFASVRYQEFRDLLTAMREIGCRPGEVLDTMRRSIQGVHQPARALTDFATGEPIGAVDENGAFKQRPKGLGDLIAIVSNSLELWTGQVKGRLTN
jgi:hypothetical protein